MTASSCNMWSTGWNWDDDNDDIPDLAFGKRGLYISADQARLIGSELPRAQENGTGIVRDGVRLYVVDLGLGVHVYDNSDPTSPIAIAFITIPGVTTVTVARDRLFADNFGDLVTIDISDPTNARVVDRDPDLFPDPLDYPLGHFGFFECYNPDLGLLVGWEDATLESPRCRM